MRGKDPRRSALSHAYKLLGYRDRSEAEMARRLRMKGFEEPEITGVISQLKDKGFLDDRRLAASLTRHAGETKHLSLAGTKKFLVERGVPPDIIEEALGGVDEADAAKRLVERKLSLLRKRGGLKPSLSDDATFRELYGILYRRGYPSEVIKKVLNQIGNKEEE